MLGGSPTERLRAPAGTVCIWLQSAKLKDTSNFRRRINNAYDRLWNCSSFFLLLCRRRFIHWRHFASLVSLKQQKRPKRNFPETLCKMAALVCGNAIRQPKLAIRRWTTQLIRFYTIPQSHFNVDRATVFTVFPGVMFYYWFPPCFIMGFPLQIAESLKICCSTAIPTTELLGLISMIPVLYFK